MLGREARAEAILAKASMALERARTTLAALPGGAVRGPLFLVRFIDEARLRVFGPYSLYGEVLMTLGLRNAWQRATNAAAFATTGFEALGGTPDATLAYLKPLPASAASMMKSSPVWHAMPFAKDDRMIGLPDVPPEGGIVSAMYFTQALVDALVRAAAHPGHAQAQPSRYAGTPGSLAQERA
jgi:iron complex transport system substrate-binding protein